MGWQAEANHVSHETERTRSCYEIMYTRVHTSHGHLQSLTVSLSVVQSRCLENDQRVPWEGGCQVVPAGTRLRTFRQVSKGVRSWIWNHNVGEEMVNIAVFCQSVSESFVSLSLSFTHTYRILDLSKNKERNRSLWRKVFCLLVIPQENIIFDSYMTPLTDVTSPGKSCSVNKGIKRVNNSQSSKIGVSPSGAVWCHIRDIAVMQ